MSGYYAAEALCLRMLGAEVIKADDIGVFAVELAYNGWRLIPLNGKVPAIPTAHSVGDPLRGQCKGTCGRDGHGVLDASADLETVTAWWRRYLGANIGAQVPDHAFVLDTDPRNGGTDSLATLVAAHGPLPATLSVVSGRGDGGSHRYYRRPFGKLTDKHLGPGIDIKTSAGYCVVPPSIHPDSGQPYHWVDAPIAEPPDWLVGLIRPPAPIVPVSRGQKCHKGRNAVNGPSIADSFTTSTTWADVLEPHGWRCIDADPDSDGARWLHPAATSACSATVRHGCLFVYSDNTPFDTTTAAYPRGYTRFRAHAVLNHHGDLTAAARELKTGR